MAALRLALQDLVKDPVLFRSCAGECRKLLLIPGRSFCLVAIQETPSLSPAVRYLVGTHNIRDVSIIRGSGPKSRLLKGDILKHLAGLKEPATPPAPLSKPAKSSPSLKSPSPVTCAEYTDLSVASERREAAAAIVRAKGDIPHVYLNVECEVPSWLVEHGEAVAQAHMIKVIAHTIQEDPMVCRVWSGSGLQPVPDVSISVSRDGTGSTQLPLNKISRMTLQDLSAAIATGISSHSDSYISVTFQRDGTGQTGILSPGQTLALHVTTGLDRRGTASNLVTVCITTDGRVLELETLARWVSALRENCSRTV